MEINESTLKAIQQSDSSDNAKVINLVKGLIKAARDKGGEQPYLIPIAERAQAVMEAYDDHQTSTKHALEELERLARERIEAEKQRKRLGLDINTFTIFRELKQENLANAQELATTINAVFQRFPNYQFNAEELRQLKAEVYKVLLAVVDGKKMVGITERLLKLSRR